jgi:hypothetical protein
MTLPAPARPGHDPGALLPPLEIVTVFLRPEPAGIQKKPRTRRSSRQHTTSVARTTSRRNPATCAAQELVSFQRRNWSAPLRCRGTAGRQPPG